jgi:RHS repeat-associated protein
MNREMYAHATAAENVPPAAAISAPIGAFGMASATVGSRSVVSSDTEPTPTTRSFLYTPELNLLAETARATSDSETIAYEYLWFAGQPIAQITTATNEIAWYFNDHLGTPILQTDATGTVIWRIEREPYGSAFSTRTGATRHQPLAFPGQEEQGGETSYNIFRWYRSGWGRYTQADPAWSALRLNDLNAFGYASMSPVMLSDATGLYVYPPGFVGPIRKTDVVSRSGTPFNSPDEAARTAMAEICGSSVREDREWGGRIYIWDQVAGGTGKYYYTMPIQGEKHGIPQIPEVPGGAFMVASYHSHGAESGPQVGDETISWIDKSVAEAYKVYSYVVTPTGRLLRYTPNGVLDMNGDLRRIGKCECR